MIDSQAKMTGMNRHPPNSKVPLKYQQLRRQLAAVGLISQGSVQDRTARQGGGAGYQWTRKVARKTVTVSLTQAQFQILKQAISNYRSLRRQLKQMEQLSRRIIFSQHPHQRPRKRLNNKVLGLI